MENKEVFQYTYSAKEQEEIKNIRSKYVEQTEDKMTQLRRLDAGVYNKASKISIIIGVVGALILGTGMSLAMTDLSVFLGIPITLAMIFGVLIGVIGIVLVACAYPIYNSVVKKERDKIAPEIIRLTDELLK